MPKARLNQTLSKLVKFLDKFGTWKRGNKRPRGALEQEIYRRIQPARPQSKEARGRPIAVYCEPMEEHALLDVDPDCREFTAWRPDPHLGSLANLSTGIIGASHFERDRKQRFDRLAHAARIAGQALEAIHREENPLARPVIGREAPSVDFVEIHPRARQGLRGSQYVSLRSAAAARDHGRYLVKKQGSGLARASSLGHFALALIELSIGPGGIVAMPSNLGLNGSGDHSRRVNTLMWQVQYN
jgi:hypothetical protein